MVRDWEIIRANLVAAEAKAPGAQLRADEVPGDLQSVAAHIEMLNDAGYLEAKILRTTTGMSAFVLKVTYTGYELLDTMRSDNTWTSIKKVAQSRGVDLTFGVVKQIASFVTDKLIKGEPIPGIT